MVAKSIATIFNRINIAYILLSILSDEFLNDTLHLTLLEPLGTRHVGGRHSLPKDVGASVVGLLVSVECELQDDLPHVKCTAMCGIVSV